MVAGGLGKEGDVAGKVERALGCALATVLLSGVGASGAGAQVYRWVDEQGRVQFSDRPRTTDEAPMELKVPPPSPGPDQGQRNVRRDRLLEVFAEERRRKQARAEEERVRRERRARECSEARDGLARLQRGGGIYELDANGERVYLTGSEIDRRIGIWRQRVEHLCAPS